MLEYLKIYQKTVPLENGKIAKCRIDGSGFGSTEYFVFRGKEGVTDNDYVYYLITTNYVRQLAVNSMTGASGRQRADLKFIKRIQWEFPTLEEQTRIANTLTAYDDLVEINRKKIECLIKMASDLYSEWFIRFRYPGYENDSFIKGKFGRVPEKFNIIKMQDAFDYYIGGGWGNDDYSEEFPIDAYVIRGTDFQDVRSGYLKSCPYRYHKKSNYESRELQPNDIILEVSGGTAEQPVGRTLLVTKDVIDRFNNKVICASFCKQIRCNTSIVSPVYFYYWMQFLYDTRVIDKFQLQSTGIINFKFEYFLRKGEILLPSMELMLEFEERINLINKQIDVLARKNENLTIQRELLQGRLMGGSLKI